MKGCEDVGPWAAAARGIRGSAPNVGLVPPGEELAVARPRRRAVLKPSGAPEPASGRRGGVAVRLHRGIGSSARGWPSPSPEKSTRFGNRRKGLERLEGWIEGERAGRTAGPERPDGAA